MKNKCISAAAFFCFYLIFLILSIFQPVIVSAYTEQTEEQKNYDIIIYGATASGVAAAVAAAREGASVALLEPGSHIGGMVSSGLSYTDKGQERVVGGIAREFFRRVGKYYNTSLSWYFEPKVGERVFNDMIREAGVSLYLNHRIREKEGVFKTGTAIKSITLENGSVFGGHVFIDSSYEGDLMAQAGVSYTWGREGREQYGESLAGVRPYSSAHNFKYPVSAYSGKGQLLPGISPEDRGEEGTGDKKVQAYNFRLCLTNIFSNRLPFTRPADYDPGRYLLLIKWLEALKDNEDSRDLTMTDVLAIGPIPGNKADINNNGPFSTNLIGGSWLYPEAVYKEKEVIIQEHKSYLQGLLYFLANDRLVPEELRNEMLAWGYAADEFIDNNNWPYLLYVREARRMKGEYVMTQKDIQEELIKEDSIGMGSYNSDSHNTQRYVDLNGNVLNEGNMEVRVNPYQIPYRAIVPKITETHNLLVPVCLSASHVAYSTLRMEPQYMIMGEAAGIASVLAIESNCAVQEVDTSYLRHKLEAVNGILELPLPTGDSDVIHFGIDNTDGEFTQKGFVSVDMKGQTGYDLLVALNNDPSVFARYRTKVQREGDYNIYMNVPSGLTGTEKVEVNCGANTYQGEIRLSEPGWIKVPGSPFHMKPEEDNAVTVISGGSSSLLVADALKLVMEGSEYSDNIAWGRPATADSEMSGHWALSVTDGKAEDSTYWSAETNGTDHWVEVDLGKTYSVAGAAIYISGEDKPLSGEILLQYKEAGDWKDIAANPVYNRTKADLELCFRKYIQTDRIRLCIKGERILPVSEVVLYGKSPSTKNIEVTLDTGIIERYINKESPVEVQGDSVDLAVDIIADRLVCPEQGEISFTINYVNRSGTAASDVIIEVRNPEDTAILSAGGGTETGMGLIWKKESLMPGEAGTLSYSVKVGELYYPEVNTAGIVSIKCKNGTVSSLDDSALFRVLLYKPGGEKLLHKPYINGNAQNEFMPEKEMTRAETAAVLVRALGLKLVKDVKPVFKDVATGHWAYDYINTAVKAGIFTGYSDKTFRPDNRMLRSDFAASLSKYLGYANINPLGVQIKKLQGHWAFNHINNLSRLALINPEKDGFSNPDASIIKIEMVVIMNRLLNRGPLKTDSQTFSDVGTAYWGHGHVEEAGSYHESQRESAGDESRVN